MPRAKKSPSAAQDARKGGILSFATTFLGRLGFAAIIARVEQMNDQIDEQKTSEGEVGPERPLTDTFQTLRLPRIIVIGDEDHGKSTVLERVAQAEVLPRSAGFCSRQPILLKLRHDASVSVDAPIFKLTIPGVVIPEDRRLTEIDVRQFIAAQMKKIKADHLGVVLDSEIVVEITSAGVPSIDLVDLPGLIQVQPQVDGEPANLADLTQQCTKKYLDDPETGAVVCVVDAQLPNLRTSLAIRKVQESRPDLQKYSICVLSKADRAVNYDWKTDGKTGPMELLEKRLAGSAETGVNLQGGSIALRNRSTLGEGAQVGLEEQTQKEYDFFLNCGFSLEGKEPLVMKDAEDKVALSVFGERQLGLRALLKKIDWIICDHLNQDWVPKQLAEVNQKRTELNSQIDALGQPVQTVTIPAIFDAVHRALSNAFTTAQVDTLGTQTLNYWPAINLENPSLSGRHAAKTALLDQYLQCVNSQALHQRLSTAVTPTIRKCFDDDKQGPMQLHRFSNLRDHYVTTFEESIRTKQIEFVLKATELIQQAFQLEPMLNLSLLPQTLLSLFMANVLLPTLARSPDQSIPFCVMAKKSTDVDPIDDHLKVRQACETKLQHLAAKEETLRSLLPLAAAAASTPQAASAAPATVVEVAVHT